MNFYSVAPVIMKVSEFIKQGISAHKDGKLSVAKYYYGKVLEKYPNHPDANHNLGILLLTLGEYKKSIIHLKLPVDERPHVSQYWISLISTLLKLNLVKDAKVTLDDSKKFGQSGGIFDTLSDQISDRIVQAKNGSIELKSPPQNVLERLTALYRDGQFKVLIHEAEYLAEKFPESHMLLNLCGVAYAALMQDDIAISFYRRSIHVNPSFADSYNNLGNAYKRLGKVDLSVDNFKRALEIRPEFFHALNNLGIAYANLGKLDLAIKNLKQAINLSPDIAEFHNNLGSFYYETGDYQASEKSLNSALELNPKFAAGYLNLAKVRLACSKYDLALKYALTASEIDPTNIGVQHFLADLHMIRDECEIAVCLYAKILALKPDYRKVQNNLIELLKTYEPQKTYGNSIIELDKEIRDGQLLTNATLSDTALAENVVNAILSARQIRPKIDTRNTQIYLRNSIDLNCDRHHELFNSLKIIPKFCFTCYKVQINVRSLLDLIRLTQIFYTVRFKDNLTRKCMIEMRPKVAGRYKGFVYCNSSKQAQNVVQKLTALFEKNSLWAKLLIKRGCSEFYKAYPSYAIIDSSNENKLQYFDDWSIIENQFDSQPNKKNQKFTAPTLRGFCLSDILILGKWIDYAKGCGETLVEEFRKLPVRDKDLYELAKTRSDKT